VTRRITFSAFLRGTGKSNLVANVACLLALGGRRVGLVDLDEAAPTQAYLFGRDPAELGPALGDALFGRAAPGDAAHDVTPRQVADAGGAVLLVPLAVEPGQVPLALRAGLDADLLGEMLAGIAAARRLDYLLLDTGNGLDEVSLSAFAMSDAVVHVMRLEKRGYQGSAVTLELARRLGVPQVSVVANLTPEHLDPAAVQLQLGRTFGCEVVAVLPYSDEMAAIGSARPFVLAYPEHPLTARLAEFAEKIA
jgi:septum site-determining protein MinD